MRRSSRNPRSFELRCNVLWLLLLAGCIAALVLSWKDGTVTMKGFPVVFFLGALSEFLNAAQHFRPDEERRRQVLSGICLVLVGLALLMVSAVSACYIWLA